MFDFRSEYEKEIMVFEDERIYSLNPDLRNWERRPEVYVLKKAKVYWNPSVHDLGSTNQILFIFGGQGENTPSSAMVNLVFYENKPPFKESKSFEVRGEHYKCGMVPCDKRAEQDQADTFVFAVMFGNNKNRDPCKIIRFAR